jgi:hypothetical protein
VGGIQGNEVDCFSERILNVWWTSFHN